MITMAKRIKTHSFRRGDKVVCNTDTIPNLTLGREYVVVSTSKELVCVRHDRGGYYWQYPEAFESQAKTENR